MESQFKYFAFISYSSKDTEWGKRLQRKLEHYRMPSKLCSEHRWKRKPMTPVFFAPTDIQPGTLSEELKKRLMASRHLIVICSPSSAQSQWVGREIEFFHQLGRSQNIHFFIVEGHPHSNDPKTECFNPVIEKLGIPEILGANINEKNYKQKCLNRERAYVQLISKMMGVEFDTIWQRHKRQIISNVIVWIMVLLAMLAMLFCMWMLNQPVNVQVKLNEISAHNDNLPPLKDAVVELYLDNKTEVDTIRTIDGAVSFKNIPHRYLNKPVRLTVSCQDFITTDTTVILTKDMRVNIARDPSVYGEIRFRFIPSEYSPHPVIIDINGHTAVPDNSGFVSLTIPLASQRRAYPVSANIPLAADTFYMPCGPNDCIIAQ